MNFSCTGFKRNSNQLWTLKNDANKSAFSRNRKRRPVNWLLSKSKIFSLLCETLCRNTFDTYIFLSLKNILHVNQSTAIKKWCARSNCRVFNFPCKRYCFHKVYRLSFILYIRYLKRADKREHSVSLRKLNSDNGYHHSRHSITENVSRSINTPNEYCNNLRRKLHSLRNPFEGLSYFVLTKV